LVTVQGATYLDAWCHSAEADRMFRLDRVLAAQVLESEVTTPAETAREVRDGLFVAAEEAVRVTLRLDPPARWVVEYYAVEASRNTGDGGLEVDLLVADERWLRRLLLRLAPHAHVIAPSEYAESFSTAAQQTLSLYADKSVD
jgi:proteasome accessory factor C